VLAWCFDVDPLGRGFCRLEVFLPPLELGARAGDALMEATQDRVDALLAREVARESDLDEEWYLALERREREEQ
jgi:hypothetical protein